MEKVPFLDLATGNRQLHTELMNAAERVLTSGRFIGGPEVTNFETAFAAHMGTPHAIGVGNGLEALILALQAVGIQPGDEVIVPAHTFIATWLAVTRLGAIPVPVEPLADTMNMNPALLAAAITPRTRAIMPVHLYGNPADMASILQAAGTIPVIADAAQAHGATYHGKPVGSYATSCWSFYPGKNLGAYGDAGAVTTLNPALAERIRRLGNYGSSVKYVHDEPNSTNSRLDPMQAAMLSVRLAVMDEWNARRAQIAQTYLSELQNTAVTLPTITPNATSAWHLFVVRTPKREQLEAHLAADGIETLIHYPTAVHQQKCYAHLAEKLPPLPLAEELAAQVISLPLGPHMPDSHVERVITSLRKFG